MPTTNANTLPADRDLLAGRWESKDTPDELHEAVCGGFRAAVWEDIDGWIARANQDCLGCFDALHLAQAACSDAFRAYLEAFKAEAAALGLEVREPGDE